MKLSALTQLEIQSRPEMNPNEAKQHPGATKAQFLIDEIIGTLSTHPCVKNKQWHLITVPY